MKLQQQIHRISPNRSQNRQWVQRNDPVLNISNSRRKGAGKAASELNLGHIVKTDRPDRPGLPQCFRGLFWTRTRSYSGALNHHFWV